MKVVLDRSAEVAEFVASIMPYPGYERGFDTVSAIGVEDDGELIGGTVFTDWSPENGTIEMSSAATSPKWLTREMVNSIFTYVFDVVKARVVVHRVAESNTRMININRRFGFNEYFIPELTADGEGLFIYTMTNSQWMQNPFNRRKNAA